MVGKGKGFGKTILFGEHFVVYGLEGIPCALGQITTAEVEIISSGKGYELIDNRPATPGYKEEKTGEYVALISRVLDYMQVKDKLQITLGGDLYCASGVGASAACAAAIARAINEEYKLGWNDEQINKAAFEGETAGSGTPSGIDNTAAVYGGFLLFKKNITGGANKIGVVKIKKPVEIVLGNSGKTALTKEVVGDVKKLKDSNPSEVQKIFDEYVALEEEAKKALQNYDLKKLGELMNKNHELLQKITVSCKELDELVEAARSAGALGAKLTGTGRGGMMIALTPGKELQEKVAKAIEAKGYAATKTVIG
ncbi:MAG: mevalonate kinase [Candidatus Diapherotrites archaeon]|nr:mevalonate kinase [Candidatus Diapherotrites archaeon]